MTFSLSLPSSLLKFPILRSQLRGTHTLQTSENGLLVALHIGTTQITQSTYLNKICPIDMHSSTMPPASRDLHNGRIQGHDNSHRNTKVFTVIRQRQGVVSSRSCDYTFCLLVLQQIESKTERLLSRPKLVFQLLF